MEGVGKADSYCETPVEDSRYHLTKDLHKDYNPEVPANLWNKDCPLTGTLLYQNPVAQIRLAQGDKIPTVCHVQGVLHRLFLYTHAEVLRPHAWCPPPPQRSSGKAVTPSMPPFTNWGKSPQRRKDSKPLIWYILGEVRHGIAPPDPP